MPISMQCLCERTFKVKDDLAGKRIRCPSCKEVLRVPIPEMETPEEEDAANYLMAEEPAPKPTKKRREEESEEHVTAKPAAWDKPKSRPRDEEDERPDPPMRKRKSRPYNEGRRSSGGYSGVHISPAIISGILMMVGAVAWFVLGIVLIDRIFFYPPILFILGIGAVWRGATGQEE